MKSSAFGIKTWRDMVPAKWFRRSLMDCTKAAIDGDGISPEHFLLRCGLPIGMLIPKVWLKTLDINLKIYNKKLDPFFIFKLMRKVLFVLLFSCSISSRLEEMDFKPE